MTTPRTPEGRVARVADGATINGTYGLPPGEALDAFRADLKELVDRPTEDAYLAACRALHWRTAELRAHGVEPGAIPADAPHYPPEGYDFAAGEPVAWAFELARARTYEDGKPVGWSNWGPPQLSFAKPCVPEGSIRNLRPLHAGDPAALRTALHLFREFVLRNVTQWEPGAGVPGHPMWAHIAGLVGEMGGIINGPLYRSDEREGQLLAEIERLRQALQPVRQHGEIECIKKLAAGEPKVLAYVNELEALVRYHRRNADDWRGIASAMGYEPNAHENVKPTTAWLRTRIAKFRAASATEAQRATKSLATLNAAEHSPDLYREVVEAVGEIEADRLIVCEFGTAEVAHAHLVSIGSIEVPAA